MVTFINLLGTVQIEKGGEVADQFRSRKSVALLGYLAIQNKPVSRSFLAAFLWPDKPVADGRRDLRWTLNYLSNLLPNTFDATRQTIAFMPGADIIVDTSRFELLLGRGDPDSLTAAVALYRGELLAGPEPDDCAEFELWLLQEREVWRQRVIAVLEKLVDYHLGQADYDTGQKLAGRWLEIDPWREKAHRQQMRLLALSGQRSAALTQFKTCRHILARELDAEPLPETMALFEQIKSGEVAPTPTTPATGVDSAIAPWPSSPYRGLATFHEADAPFFFGREYFINRLVTAVQQQPMMAVVGPSGSGKSSVIQAGLLPRLRPAENETRDAWQIAVFRPGPQPVHALAHAMIPLLTPNLTETEHLLETGKLARTLLAAEVSPAELIKTVWAKNPERSRLLLVIDQFEELYTLGADEALGRHFVDLLLQIAEPRQPDTPSVHLILTLRADFMSQALAYRPLADALQDADLKLGPMTRTELSQVIEKPAQKQGVGFEAGLINRILDDVSREPGHLPLLEFALTALWDEQAKAPGPLSHAAYDAIGQVHGALAYYADQIYAGLGETGRARTRRVLLQMVQPGAGTEDTRRVATQADIGREDWPLVQWLADTRLVVTDRNAAGAQIVEVVHEALIQNWGQLRAWLNEDRAFRVWQERLRVAQQQWEVSHRDDGALLRGTLLAEAEGWRQSRADEISLPEQEFIAASESLRDRWQLETEAQRQRELAQAQALAEAEHRRAEVQARASRRLRWLAAGLAVVFLLAVGAAIFAGIQRREAQQQALAADAAREEALAAGEIALAEQEKAETQARLALSRQLAAQALTQLDRRFDLSLLLSRQAYAVADVLEAKSSLLTAITAHPHLVTFLYGHTDAVFRSAFSPDGWTLATASWDGTVRVWDMTTKQSRGELIGHDGAVLDVAFRRDGQTIVTAGDDGQIILWDVTTRQPIRQLPARPDEKVWNITFNPAETIMASSGSLGDIILWDTATWQPLAEPLKGHINPVLSLAFSPDGGTLASSGDDSQIILWDVATQKALGKPLTGHVRSVWGLAFSPNGQILASAGRDSLVRLWDVPTRQLLGEPLSGHDLAIFDLVFNVDGTMLVTGSSDNTIRLWDVASREAVGEPLTGHSGAVYSVAFTPDGQTLVSGSQDTTVALWDINHASLLGHAFADQHEELSSVIFSPQGDIIATGSTDGTITLWDVGTGHHLAHLSAHASLLINMAFSPDGQRLISAAADHGVYIWDMATYQPVGASFGEILTDYDTNANKLWSMALSPDGEVLVLGDGAGTLEWWDVASRKVVAETVVNDDPNRQVTGLAFGPDGQTLASASSDLSIVLWDVASRRPLGQPLTGHDSPISSLTFSPDGQTLASGSDDKTIVLWDVVSQQPIGQPLVAHTDLIQALAYSHDGRILASSDQDGTIILWDVETRQPISRPFFQQADDVQSLAFSPTENLLVTVSDDGTSMVWNIDFETWLAQACQRANRNLTQLEWEQFVGSDPPYQKTCPDLPGEP